MTNNTTRCQPGVKVHIGCVRIACAFLYRVCASVYIPDNICVCVWGGGGTGGGAQTSCLLDVAAKLAALLPSFIATKVTTNVVHPYFTSVIPFYEPYGQSKPNVAEIRTV